MQCVIQYLMQDKLLLIQMNEEGKLLYHKLVTIHLILFGFKSMASRLIVSLISTSGDNLGEGDDGEVMEDEGLSDLLEQLSSTSGFCLTSFALLIG